MASSITLKERHEAYICRWESRGGTVHRYTCPKCQEELTTPAPGSGDTATWDSLSTCHHCGHLHFKIVNHRGARGFVPPTECRGHG